MPTSAAKEPQTSAARAKSVSFWREEYTQILRGILRWYAIFVRGKCIKVSDHLCFSDVAFQSKNTLPMPKERDASQLVQGWDHSRLMLS